MCDAQPNTKPVVVWGTYDLSKPRTRILIQGLRENGAEVIEIHASVWPNHADKSQLRPRVLMLALIRAILAYPRLVFRLLRAPREAVVLVPYLGALDVIVLWPFSRIRGQRVVWDMFLSLYDTVVNDRQMVSRRGPGAALLFCVEWLATRAADLVVMDTNAHARHIAKIFGLPSDRVTGVPVGVETDHFPRLPEVLPGPRPKVLFYGQLIPLHGISTIIAAIQSDRGRAIDWRIVGTGQDRTVLEMALKGAGGPSNATWEEWLPYEELIVAIGKADICLGIFGASEKAASVVPNKVWQALSAGRAVITRDSPAMRETFTPGDGLTLVPHSDPGALLDAIETVWARGCPAMPVEQLDMARPEHIGSLLRDVLVAASMTMRNSI